MQPKDLFIKILMTFILCWNQVLATETFSFQPVTNFGFKVDLKTTKKGSKLVVKKLFRDREGDSYALIYTIGSFPVIGGKTTSNMPEILPQDNLYTIVRISPQGDPIWAFHLNNKGNREFSIHNFKVSPQGNIAIILGFQGDLEVQGSLRKFRSINKDLLYLFMKKDRGALVKTLHFTGRDDETAGDITWGTGGENLIHFKSKSQKVSFEHGYYIFGTRQEPPQYKDVVFRLKRNFFPKWTRSIEPSALTSVTFYDEDKVLLTFDHLDERQGFWRKGTAIKAYSKPKRSKPRGIAVSLDSEGKKKWELQLRHLKGGGSFNGSKAFPDGSVGLTGVMSDEEIELYGFKSYKKQDKKDRVLLFYKVSNVGLLENDAMLVGENTMASLYPTNSASSIFFVSSGEKTSLHYNGFKDSAAKIKPSQSQYCPHLFIVNEDNKPTYELEKNNCKNTSGLKGADLRLASGFLEILRVHGQSLELLKVKYGQEKLDDETIPGLAYTPNFINEKTASGQSVEYTMSYAVPQKVIGVMVYFISDKRDHLEALRDPLFQASLNAAYFRNYVPVTIWSSGSQIQGSRVEGLFEKIIEKKILKMDWPWYMQAFGERAQQINSLYKDPNFKMAGKLDPKLLILWNFKDFPVSDNKKLRAEQVKQQVARSRPSLFISPWKNEKQIEKVQDLYYEFDRQRKKSSHIITEPQPVRKMSFAAISKVGIEKSEEIKRELEKNNCLTKKNTFKKSPAHSEFRHQCLDNFEAVKDFAPTTLERVHQFMKELYHPSDYIPYYDKEIYNFIEARDKEGPKGKSDPGP